MTVFYDLMAVESSYDANISKTLDETILSWNAGTQNLFGYSEAGFVHHTSLPALIGGTLCDRGPLWRF